MKKTMILISIIFSFSAQAQLQPMTITEAEALVQNPSPQILEVLLKTPVEYSYTNTSGESTVNYLGQVMRQVLINDTKLAFGSYNRGQMEGKALQTFGKLNSYYRYDFKKDGLSPFMVKAKNTSGGNLPIYEGFYYSDIFPRKIDLRSKMAGNDKIEGVENNLRHGKLLGWNTPEYEGVEADADGDEILTPDDLFLSFMVVISENAGSSTKSFTVTYPDGTTEDIRKAHVTPTGLDLAQLSQKLLHSAVSFSQAAGDYLSVDRTPSEGKGLFADNSAPLKERTYSVLEHHWDEAFGYFGASRNYLDYDDEEVKAGISKDSYSSEDVLTASDELLYANQSYDGGDGEISLQAEKNFGLSINAAKRDLGDKSGYTDFSTNIMMRFLRGRQYIQEKPEGYLLQAQAEATLLIAEWEKLLGANVIHYINATLKDYEVYGQEKHRFKDLAKHYSEMKGFAFAFQFNPSSQVKTSDFEMFHKLIGDKPADPMGADVANYKKALLEARDILEKSFQFDTDTVKAW